MNIQCRGNCSTPSGIAALFGALVCAGGVAIVSVLVLRAMGEWRRISEEQLEGPGDDDVGDGGDLGDGRGPGDGGVGEPAG